MQIGTIYAIIIKIQDLSIYFGLARNFEAGLLWLAGSVKTLEISRDFRLGESKRVLLAKKALKSQWFQGFFFLLSF